MSGAQGKGSTESYLKREEIHAILKDGLGSLSLDGKRVLFLIPDATRTMPMPLVFDSLQELLKNRTKQMDFLVALGTHQPLSDAQLSHLVGKPVRNGKVGDIRLINHAWDKPETFSHIGTIPSTEVSHISGGLLAQDVPIRINKLIYEYDQVIICGPVFPHEVAGFSGGNKYFFPGIAGPEIINFTHWLGALITSYQVIGRMHTPVRAIIERAAEFINLPTACFAFVVDHQGVAGLCFGPPMQAWQSAAEISSIRHIVYKEKPFNRVLSLMPRMYDDLWTAAKGMYKLEPVVADAGEVIIYAPHIHEVSYTHGKLIDEIGYHCRDYFLSQWERFKGYPGGVLAHATHLTGMGAYDLQSGIETPRIHVTLATGISAERCKKINLGYVSPEEIHVEEWSNREEEGILVVEQAGETLFRLK
jgi:nickel-dependent lactate racemase